MRKLLTFLALLVGISGYGANRISLSITVSNLPVTGNALGFSAPATKLITWTNTANASDYVQTNLTRAGCATNLFLQMSAYAPWTPRPGLQWSSPTSFWVTAECDAIITVTNSGTWAVLALDTNDCARLLDVRVPIASEKFATSRVYIASMLVKGMNDYPTNTFDTNAPAFTNYLSLGPHPQWSRGSKYFYGIGGTNIGLTNGAYNYPQITNAAHIHGSNVYLYHGYTTNIKADNMSTTNLINYNNAISSKNTNGAGEQFGLLAIANGSGSPLAVGAASLASGDDATAIATLSIASGDRSLAVGNESEATAADSTAIGSFATAGKPQSSAFGYDTTVGHTNSTALGAFAATDAEDQIMLGSSTVAYVKAFGRFTAGSITNNIYTGTNQNRGDWADEEITVSTLANGNNIAVSPTNVFMRLIAGPTANFTINGIQNGRSGKQLWLYNDTGQQMTLAHESGVDPTPANRIYCTSGGDIVFGTNALTYLKYSAAKSRWIAQINTNAITLANNSVTDGILRDSGALSVIGRAANSTGDPADISSAANGQTLVRTNSTLAWGKISLTNASMFDVNPVGQTNDQVLTFHASSGTWTNKTRRPYTMSFWQSITGLNPADSTTYYVGGNQATTIGTTYSATAVTVPWAGTITGISVGVQVGGTLGTTEDVQHMVRVNDTTDSAVLNLDYDQAWRSGASGALSTAVAAGDTIALKIVAPAWVTNPTTVRVWATIFIE